jgi:hypothetical protein
VKAPHAAILAFAGFFLTWTLRYGHFELFMTIMAFIFPFRAIEYIRTGTQRRPGRSFGQIRTAAFGTYRSSDDVAAIRYGYPENMTALPAQK